MCGIVSLVCSGDGGMSQLARTLIELCVFLPSLLLGGLEVLGSVLGIELLSPGQQQLVLAVIVFGVVGSMVIAGKRYWWSGKDETE